MHSGTVSDEHTMTKTSDIKVHGGGWTPPTVSQAGHLLGWTLRWLQMHRCAHSLHSSWWCLVRITLLTWRPGLRKVKEPARGLHSNGKELLMQPVLPISAGQETEDGIGITFGIQQVKHHLQFCYGFPSPAWSFPHKGTQHPALVRIIDGAINPEQTVPRSMVGGGMELAALSGRGRPTCPRNLPTPPAAAKFPLPGLY